MGAFKLHSHNTALLNVSVLPCVTSVSSKLWPIGKSGFIAWDGMGFHIFERIADRGDQFVWFSTHQLEMDVHWSQRDLERKRDLERASDKGKNTRNCIPRGFTIDFTIVFIAMFGLAFLHSWVPKRLWKGWRLGPPSIFAWKLTVFGRGCASSSHMSAVNIQRATSPLMRPVARLPPVS